LSAARRAYTLIEVLIVVAILGLAAAVLIPSMSGRGDFDTQAAVRALISDISFAQSDALANQSFRRIHFYEGGTGWCLVKLAEDELAQEFDPETADFVVDPLKGAARGGTYAIDFVQDDRYASVRVEGVSIDGGKRDITFDELGGTVTSGGTESILMAVKAYRDHAREHRGIGADADSGSECIFHEDVGMSRHSGIEGSRPGTERSSAELAGRESVTLWRAIWICFGVFSRLCAGLSSNASRSSLSAISLSCRRLAIEQSGASSMRVPLPTGRNGFTSQDCFWRPLQLQRCVPFVDSSFLDT
jgi:prepilin-type N-terminal cleavage/methylation domain-containing protein